MVIHAVPFTRHQDHFSDGRIPPSTGVDLSNILGCKPKYWGEKVAITDESTGVSQLLGARARAAPPKVYTHASKAEIQPES